MRDTRGVYRGSSLAAKIVDVHVAATGFSPEEIEALRAVSSSPVTSKMACHNAYYRERAVHLLQADSANRVETRDLLARPLDRPQKTILAELGRIGDPRQLLCKHTP